MPELKEVMEAACAHHQQGRPDKAEILYQQVLEADPSNRQALISLGSLYLQTGRTSLALEALGLAASLHPEDPAAVRSLGAAYQAQGQMDQARDCLERALALDAGSAETLRQMARLHSGQGDWPQAVELFRKALAISEDHAPTHLNLGNALIKTGDWAGALACFHRAAELDPKDWAALNNLGGALRRLGRPEEAVEVFERALLLDPGNPGLTNNLAGAFVSLGRLEKAEELFSRVCALAPKWAAARNNLGLTLLRRGKMDQALACFVECLAMDEKNPKTPANLGWALYLEGKALEAAEAFSQSLELARDNPEAFMGLAHTLLARGDYQEGWETWNRAAPPAYAPEPGLPVWQGEGIEGGGLLVWADSSLSDTLMQIRALPLLRARGVKIYLDHPAQWGWLLLEAKGVHGPATRVEEKPLYKAHSPLSRIPGLLELRPELIDSHPLPAKPAAEAGKWAEALRGVERPMAGLAWACQDGEASDAARTPGAECWAGLAGLKGVELVPLQQGASPPGLKMRPLPQPESLEDALSLMQALDLVITPDCWLAHLASAAGLPVWVLLGPGPGWSWGLEGAVSAWHPSARLFRCEDVADWSVAGAELAAALKQWINSRPQ